MLSEWLMLHGRQKVKEAGLKKQLQAIESGIINLTPEILIDVIYYKLRTHSYPISERDNLEIRQITGSSTNQILAEEENGWHFRYPKNRHAIGWRRGDKVVDRVSLNVHAEEELIKKLDNFCSKHKVYYKCPEQIANWEERHDSVTLYFMEPVTTGIQQELVELITPHVRGNDLLGQEIAKGIYLETSPTPQDIDILIERAKKIHPQLGAAVKKRASGGTELALSSGQLRAVEIMLASYEEYTAKNSRPPLVVKSASNSFINGNWQISSYNGTYGKMLALNIVGSPNQIASAEKELISRGYVKGQDFTNRSGRRVNMIGTAVQPFLTEICRVKNIDPKTVLGK